MVQKGGGGLGTGVGTGIAGLEIIEPGVVGCGLCRTSLGACCCKAVLAACKVPELWRGVSETVFKQRIDLQKL